MSTINVHDFTITPGPRYRTDGRYSGEEFREEVLMPAFERARISGVKLRVDLDNTAGYATSFLEEAFGGLARALGPDEVLQRLEFKSEDEPYLVEEIREYISEAELETGPRVEKVAA